MGSSVNQGKFDFVECFCLEILINGDVIRG